MIVLEIKTSADVLYAWDNWIHHFLNIRSWNDKVIQEFKKLPSSFFATWLWSLGRKSFSDRMNLKAIDQFNTIKSWFIAQVFGHNRIDLPSCILIFTVIGCNRRIRLHHISYPMRERPRHIF